MTKYRKTDFPVHNDRRLLEPGPTSPKLPKAIHYRRDGEFMISGEETRKWRKVFRPEML